jgi:plasmid stabilization system protein ParE
VTRNFAFTPEAEADVLAIWERIADDDSEARADYVLARIYDECEKLGGTPGMGHYREELLDQRHKFWSVWSYLIVYRWQLTNSHPDSRSCPWHSRPGCFARCKMKSYVGANWRLARLGNPQNLTTPPYLPEYSRQ